MQGWVKKHKGAGMESPRSERGEQDWEGGAREKVQSIGGSRDTRRTGKRSTDREAGMGEQN